MVHKTLNCLGEIGHGSRSGLAGLDLVDGTAQALDGGTDLAGHAGRDCRFGGLIIDSGGKPVLEFRVEAVLRLA